MTVQTGANLYTQGFGSYPENVEIPIVSNSTPPTSSSGIPYPIGKRWIDQTTNTSYTLTSVSTANGMMSYNWQLAASAISAVSTISGNTGTALPASGNITIEGTSGQINTVASGNTLFVNVADPFTITDLSVTGIASVGGSLIVTGAASIAGNLTSNGSSITLGTNTSNVNIGQGNVVISPTSLTMAVGLNVDTAIVPSGYTMTAKDCFVGCNTLTGAVSVSLPATPVTGQMIYVCDLGGSGATNNITINGNSKLIDTSGSTPLPTTTITTNYGTCFLIFNSARWSVIARS